MGQPHQNPNNLFQQKFFLASGRMRKPEWGNRAICPTHFWAMGRPLTHPPSAPIRTRLPSFPFEANPVTAVAAEAVAGQYVVIEVLPHEAGATVAVGDAFRMLPDGRSACLTESICLHHANAYNVQANCQDSLV